MAPGISLRNGHLHTKRIRRLLDFCIMVMAETQDLPEFLVPAPLPVQAAWTPPPAFLFLPIQLSKSIRLGIRRLLTIEVNNRRTRSLWVTPASRTSCSCESRARIGRRSSVCPERVPNKYYRPVGVNTSFIFFSPEQDDGLSEKYADCP